MLQAYSKSLQERPLLTKASTAALLNGLQELIASKIAQTGDPQTAIKSLKMALYGFFVSGPMGHTLFAVMEHLFANQHWLLKLLFSNLVITPIQNAVYLFFLGLFAGANTKNALQVVKTRLLGVMKISWVISPAVQIFAFKNLEQQYWVPFFNFVAFVFGTAINTRTKLEAKKKSVKK
ncbi:hypothetical protein EDD86DRAFT_233167 [Gorgonomyces haynaldii]|nr:hypothetical protein EDD86DRAFT_233167 [Gorgonomyces haynaldii]